MIYKRKTKNKQEIRKKLINYNYELEYKDAVKKGLEIFNDKIVGETWTKEVEFIITKCDFNWKMISSDNKILTFCECEVFNINSTRYYRTLIYINKKIGKSDISRLTERIERSMVKNIEEKDVNNWKRGNRRFFTGFNGNVTCQLFDSEFIYKISIPIPKKLLENVSSYEIDDYDWERENFNALTDGQYGDYDDFDGDFDRLDDWRGG